ncbi:MAG: heme-binding protein [Actinomycetota bacterium]|nr:heme-binding protein [Actinomycetota bacterium]
MTEQQRYEVVGRGQGFELRRYPAHLVAEVEVDGSFEAAGNAAFRPLVAYIRGQNQTSRSLAMTAPVLQRRDDPEDPLAAAETRTTETSPGRYVVSFVMPQGATRESLPDPGDDRVTIRAVAEELAAVARYSGRWTSASYEQQTGRLLRAVKEAGFETIGPPRFARFDPPWTPWFRRRNEVVVPVRES